jgi:hypothetical protein
MTPRKAELAHGQYVYCQMHKKRSDENRLPWLVLLLVTATGIPATGVDLRDPRGRLVTTGKLPGTDAQRVVVTVSTSTAGASRGLLRRLMARPVAGGGRPRARAEWTTMVESVCFGRWNVYVKC